MSTTAVPEHVLSPDPTEQDESPSCASSSPGSLPGGGRPSEARQPGRNRGRDPRRRLRCAAGDRARHGARTHDHPDPTGQGTDHQGGRGTSSPCRGCSSSSVSTAATSPPPGRHPPTVERRGRARLPRATREAAAREATRAHRASRAARGRLPPAQRLRQPGVAVIFSAVLDANVLYSFSLRDTLLRLAELRLHTPLWSERILDEMRRNLAERQITEQQAGRIVQRWPRVRGS